MTFSVVFLTLTGWFLVGGVLWNLQRAFRFGVIRSRGEHHRGTEPVQFWVSVGFNIFGFLFGAAIVALTTFALVAA
jgi:hypothetical protein